MYNSLTASNYLVLALFLHFCWKRRPEKCDENTLLMGCIKSHQIKLFAVVHVPLLPNCMSVKIRLQSSFSIFFARPLFWLICHYHKTKKILPKRLRIHTSLPLDASRGKVHFTKRKGMNILFQKTQGFFANFAC